MVSSRLIPRFSILSLLLLTSIVALILLIQQQRRHYQRREMQLSSELANKEKRSVNLGRRLISIRQQFEGIHGDPVVVFCSPTVYPKPHFLMPNVGLGQRSSHVLNFGAIQETWKLRKRLKVELMLLNSQRHFQTFGGGPNQPKKSDYYRLNTNTVGWVSAENGKRRLSADQCELFAYDGTPTLALQTPDLVVALGPDRPAAFAKLLEGLPSELATQLSEEFTDRESMIAAQVCKGSTAK